VGDAVTTADVIRALELVEKNLEHRQRLLDVRFQLEGVRAAIELLRKRVT
jgi:hypothetical protein